MTFCGAYFWVSQSAGGPLSYNARDSQPSKLVQEDCGALNYEGRDLLQRISRMPIARSFSSWTKRRPISLIASRLSVHDLECLSLANPPIYTTRLRISRLTMRAPLKTVGSSTRTSRPNKWLLGFVWRLALPV